MARPKKDGLDYFPVDVSFDEKVQAIDMLHENGIKWVIKFWQKAYQTMTGLVDFRGLFAELFAKNCRITIEEHEKILETAVLVHFCYEHEEGVYTSNGIQKRISAVSKDREDAIERQNNKDKVNKKKSKSKSRVKDCPDYSANNSGTMPADKKTVPPLIEWVVEYCKERKNSVDPNKWFDHYTANGWKVGKTKMVDWKASVRTWERSTTQQQSLFSKERPINEYERGAADKYNGL